MRIVLDTNVIVSAFHFHGSVQEVVDIMVSGEDTWLVSPFILWEVDRVLADKFGWSLAEQQALKSWITGHANIVEPTDVPDDIKVDSSDNHILAAAWAGQADLIVSGDSKHLLPLGQWRGIPLLPPRAFLDTR